MSIDYDAIAAGLTQAVPFAGFLGLEITEVGPGRATVQLPDRAELGNHVGSQHAGALFTAAALDSSDRFGQPAAALTASAGRRQPVVVSSPR